MKEGEITVANKGFRRAESLLLLAALCLVTLLLQARNGAFTSDIGADPDEPAHAVTALMLRDYLAHGLPHGVHPLRFAENYYQHFPKVAIGHYPPLFYTVAGAWMLPLPNRTWLIVLMGLLCGAMGWLTAQLASACGFRKGTAALIGLWCVLLPLSQKQAMLVMSDSMLCCGLLMSAWMFSRFMDEPGAKHSLAFGAWAAATMLIKGSGIALALVPPFAIALTRRWHLIGNWRLWLAPLPVAVTAVPWTLATKRITAEGMVDTPLLQYVREAIAFYGWAAGYSFGWLILAAAAAGLCFGFRKRISPLAASLIAMAAGVLALYLVVPTGFSSRYLLPLAPPLLIAASLGIAEVCRLTNILRHGVWALAVFAILSVIMLGSVKPKDTSGFGAVASSLLQSHSPTRVLVSSDARGEGSLIAELAFRLPDRLTTEWTVERATKFLASSDWIGRGYALRFKDAAALDTGLRDEGIHLIVVDAGLPAYHHQPHHDLIAAWCAGRTPLFSAPVRRHDEGDGGTMRVFTSP